MNEPAHKLSPTKLLKLLYSYAAAYKGPFADKGKEKLPDELRADAAAIGFDGEGEPSPEVLESLRRRLERRMEREEEGLLAALNGGAPPVKIPVPPKRKRGRPLSSLAATRREIIRRVAAQEGATGERYCNRLHEAGLSTPMEWQKAEGCPKEYLDAWNHPDQDARRKWRQRISNEKSKYTHYSQKSPLARS